jgi:phosphate transport system substrate-binding protein
VSGPNKQGRQRRLHSPLLGGLTVMLFLLVSAHAVSGEFAGGAARQVLDASIPSYGTVPDVSGNFVVTGSETMQPLLLQLVSRFKQLYPHVKIALQTHGTEKGFKQFLSDQAQIRRGDGFYNGQHVSGSASVLASSRELTPHELKDFHSRYGYDPIGVPIAMGAVVIYVHKDNPVQGLSLDQLDAIFGRDRKRGYREEISTWGQIGVPGPWAREPIHLYGRDVGSATRTIMKTIALLEGEFKGTVRLEPGSASQILAIGRDRAGIGYVGIGYQTSAVRPVPLAEKPGMPFVHPTARSVSNGSYPMGRSLYLYAKREAGDELKAVIREFLKYANSREGQVAVAKSGAFPLTSEQVARNLRTVEGSMASTSETLTAGVNP